MAGEPRGLEGIQNGGLHRSEVVQQLGNGRGRSGIPGKSGGHMESEESWLGQEDPGHSGDYRPRNLGRQKSCGC